MQRPNKDELIKEAAAERIFASRDALLSEQRSLKRQQAELAAREREIDRELAECRAAARFFGLEFEPPGPTREIAQLQAHIHSVHTRMRDALNRNSPQEAESLQVRISSLQSRLRELMVRKEIEESQPSLVLVEADEERKRAISPSLIKAKKKMPKLRDVALDQLRESGSAGQKASAIQKYIENTYSIKIHDKTVGMTLYRLLQSNLVHRKGQIWFFGPSNHEEGPRKNESPDTGVPGPTQKVLEEAQ